MSQQEHIVSHRCIHPAITVDDTLDAMALTHDAFTVEFKQMLRTAAKCDLCGKTYFDATAEAMLRTHKWLRHGKPVAK